MRNYFILKNCHYSTMLSRIFCLKDKKISLKKNIIFDDSCLYKIDEKSCVNKLFGICYGLFNVHKFSDRFGWACVEDKIDIYAYSYNNGKLSKHHIYTVYPGEEHTYEINMEYSNGKRIADFKIDGISAYVSTFEMDKKLSKFGYGLTFYFGGDTRAPHTMKLTERK